MSRAFVKEEDPESPIVLPDKPVSDHPNYMTRTGYALQMERVVSLKAERDSLDRNADLAARTRRAEIVRDLRYAERRLESAEIVEPETNHRVRFGHQVEFTDEDGQSHLFQIVGEDEANPAQGKLFYASPLAQTLIGGAVGDVMRWKKGDREVEIEIVRICRFEQHS